MQQPKFLLKGEQEMRISVVIMIENPVGLGADTQLVVYCKLLFDLGEGGGLNEKNILSCPKPSRKIESVR